jgi:Dyp-type peroxidase family
VPNAEGNFDNVLVWDAASGTLTGGGLIDGLEANPQRAVVNVTIRQQNEQNLWVRVETTADLARYARESQPTTQGTQIGGNGTPPPTPILAQRVLADGATAPLLALGTTDAIRAQLGLPTLSAGQIEEKLSQLQPLDALASVQRWTFQVQPLNGTFRTGDWAFAEGTVDEVRGGIVQRTSWDQWVWIADSPAANGAPDDRLGRPLMAIDARAQALLENLQPNIVQPHPRDTLVALFFKIDGDDPSEAKTRIAALAATMKTAWDQYGELQTFRATNQGSSQAFIGIGLSAQGYQALTVAGPPRAVPVDSTNEFADGMLKASTARFGDDVTGWDKDTFSEDTHVIVLVGSNEAETTTRTADDVVKAFAGALSLVGKETGTGQKNEYGKGVEHFGYVDGRSQPLFTKADLDRETSTTDGTGVWNPLCSLRHVLVQDPAGGDDAFGSYLVFRKLEQDVGKFAEQRNAVVKALGKQPATPEEQQAEAERAGALLIGRFQDGTPLAVQDSPGASRRTPALNNFRYGGDPGTKCPFGAHVRRVNSRPFSANNGDPVLTRRGQTYGDKREPADLRNLRPPAGEVGLLFMAVVADIGKQFEAVQIAMRRPFPRSGTPRSTADPILGGVKVGLDVLPDGWGGNGTAKTPQPVSVPVDSAVTLRGGEYFFLPSIAFLKRLPTAPAPPPPAPAPPPTPAPAHHPPEEI